MQIYRHHLLMILPTQLITQEMVSHLHLHPIEPLTFINGISRQPVYVMFVFSALALLSYLLLQIPNQYRVTGVGTFTPPNRVVTFLDHSQERYGVSVPNPKYFELHGAVARILHLSGAGEAIDLIMDRFNKHQGGVPSDHKYRTGSAFRALISTLRLVAPLA